MQQGPMLQVCMQELCCMKLKKVGMTIGVICVRRFHSVLEQIVSPYMTCVSRMVGSLMQGELHLTFLMFGKVLKNLVMKFDGAQRIICW